MTMRIDVHFHSDDSVPPWAVVIQDQLGQVLTTIMKVATKMSQMDDEIAQLQTDVTALRGVEDSAIALINGIAQKIADAVAAALAAGATPAQLQAVSDLSTAVKTDADDLAAAVAANP